MLPLLSIDMSSRLRACFPSPSGPTGRRYSVNRNSRVKTDIGEGVRAVGRSQTELFKDVLE
jgi:hypothetical protein